MGERQGKIITFYSYKGGTGRSMALANVAWLLASSGKRVLVIDWDLEAPGLHRYLEPFLEDKTLSNSTGVIDFVMEISAAAVAAKDVSDDAHAWYEPCSDILAHAVPIQWDFGNEGVLHLVPAGRQDSSYATRINSFDWQSFYERVGGGIIFQKMRDALRLEYDFILIDSRTGVSDTSGICTVALPDELVVCFTMNRQSIVGAAAVARSVSNQRSHDNATFKIWPVECRVEKAELDRLEVVDNVARAHFAPVLRHLKPDEASTYWGEIAIPYVPYYAYEELLSPFRDQPSESSSLVAKMSVLARYLGAEQQLPILFDEGQRLKGLAQFTVHSAFDYLTELELLADEYEHIRRAMPVGRVRTFEMTQIVTRAMSLAKGRDAGQAGESIYKRGSDGQKVVGLALGRLEPQKRHVDMVVTSISEPRSRFEQFQALNLALSLVGVADPVSITKLQDLTNAQIGGRISKDDPARFNLAIRLTGTDAGTPLWTSTQYSEFIAIGAERIEMLRCKPHSATVRYADLYESHGPFVQSRGAHQLSLPRFFSISKFCVTNGLYQEFIRDGGYDNDRYWKSSSLKTRLRNVLTRDGNGMGPASWPNSDAWPEDESENHPVSHVCFREAEAFVEWLNLRHASPGYQWALPTDDLWEYAARGESGTIYPWGDSFSPEFCNSSESGQGRTTRVERFAKYTSHVGCCDLSGNVWEFIAAKADSGGFVMRGGSFKNDRFLIRTFLRLSRVSVWHRPDDFGIRIVRLVDSSEGSVPTFDTDSETVSPTVKRSTKKMISRKKKTAKKSSRKKA